MSEQVVIVDMSMEMDDILKYGLHVERVVEYLVKERFVSMCMFLRPEGSSVAQRNKKMMKSGGKRLTDFLGLWPESLWQEPRPENGAPLVRQGDKTVVREFNAFGKSQSQSKGILKNVECSQLRSSQIP